MKDRASRNLNIIRGGLAINQTASVDRFLCLYYYVRNFCNLIGLEHTGEIPTGENYKPFVGSSIT